MKNVSKTAQRFSNLLTGIGFLAITLFSACDKPIPTIPVTNIPHTPSALPERVIMDTAYGTDSKQKMDIYLPAGRNNTTKVIFLIHGGGWLGGGKSEMTQFRSLIKTKWPEAAVININYRLTSSPVIHHQEIMDDIKAAVNFVTSNKNSFAVSDTLAMLGASAGAQLALLYTYTQNSNNQVKCVADLYGPCVIDDWSWYNSFSLFAGMAVKDILVKYNGTTLEANPTLYTANSPYRRVQANSKPTIIFHGTVDVVVPLYQSQWLNSRLAELGVSHEYYEYADFHGFNATNNMDCIDKTVSFFKRHIRQ